VRRTRAFFAYDLIFRRRCIAARPMVKIL
jgi:hypothetical protein